jgi:Protein of unknown function (DUF2950)
VRRAVAVVAAVAAVAAAVVAAAAGADGGSKMRITKNSIRTRARVRLAGLAGALAMCLALTPVAFAQQKAFATPEAAMNAFGDALARSDSEAMHAVLGADYHRFIPPVGVDVRYRFLAAWAKAHSIKPDGDAKAAIAVGNDGWTLPIPIVKTAQGWRFDTRAGAEEMRIRRIGRNELAVMQTMLAIYDAQMEYALADRNGDGVREYATRFQSSPGKQDGLYWPAKTGEATSPLGAAFAAAQAAGYYGYRFKLLNSQGKSAPGGAYDYTVRNHKIGGFAAVAWPVKYGDSGVMTFMVSHDGVVYQKDLGPGTAAHASAITRFDPDSTWVKVDPSK